MSETLYGNEFYSNQRAGSYQSAKVVLPIVFDLVRPKSVVDVGCGVGTWLAVSAELGAKELLGFEGEWVKNARLGSLDLAIRYCDLEKNIMEAEKFDLALCLEVAEHLSAARGPSLIHDLCSLSDIVLFSAAIPRQGGKEHVNERWQSYWAEQFACFGFKPYDVVRPIVWNDDSVEWWYRQNAVLYAHSRACHLLGEYKQCETLNIVHPRLWQQPAGLKYILQQLPIAARGALVDKLRLK
jgi:SAM-dependent methyltransferase